MRRSERNLAEPDLGMLTHHMTAALQRALATALAGEGERQLGPRHRAILACLDDEGSRAVEVARQSGQHKQVVGTLADDLEQLGYVRRQPDPADRRAKLIVPTEAGRRQISRTDAAIARIERDIAASLGDQRYRDFKQAFRQVAELLGRPQPPAIPGQCAAVPLPPDHPVDTPATPAGISTTSARGPGATGNN